VATEDGKFEKRKYVPPSDPEAAQAAKQGEAVSLVTASLMAIQKE